MERILQLEIDACVRAYKNYLEHIMLKDKKTSVVDQSKEPEETNQC